MDAFPRFLVKYCRAQHNPTAQGTHIQIGTLDYYREYDPSFLISDSHEAEHAIRIAVGGPVQFDANISERLFGTAMKITSQVTVAPGDRLEATWSMVNAFVFSCCLLSDSVEPTLETARSVSPEYDSFYIIDDDRGFAQLVAERLIKESRSQLLSEKATKRLLETPIGSEFRLSIKTMGAPVEYVSNKEFVYSVETLAEAPHYSELLMRSIFMKHEQYRDQHEFRFVWIVESSYHGPLAVRKQPYLVPLNPFDAVFRCRPTPTSSSERTAN